MAIVTTVVVDASAPVPRAGHELYTGQVRPSIFLDFASPTTMDVDVAGPSQPVGTEASTCFNAKVRMRLEHELRGRERLEERCTLQVNRLKERDAEIASLKAQLSLKEAEAAEVIRLRGQIANLSCDDLSVKASTLECEKDKLVNQVSVLEADCSGLCDEVLGYKLFKERIEEMQDAQTKALSDRVAGIYSDFLGMALHMGEEFYPRFLTTIAERRWILSCSVKLIVVKCLHSLEYMAALGKVIGRAIDKGMQDRLLAGIEHEKAERSPDAISAYNPTVEDNYVAAINALRTVDFPLLAQLESLKDASMIDVMDLLCLEGPAAEAPRTSQLQPSLEQLMVPIHQQEDQAITGEIYLSFSLEVAHNRVQRIRGDASARRLSLTDVIVPLIEPLSTKSLVGKASTPEVPATTTAL
ncbi:hypothetical protein Tco_1241655 [Tanacetum coccineum]